MTNDVRTKYPGNSIIAERVETEIPEKKRVTRVVQGTVTMRKPPLLERIVAGETTRNIVEYIIWDVLIPAAKSTFSDIVTNSIDMALYGEDRGRRSYGGSRLKRDRDRTYVSYGSMYDRSRNPRTPRDVERPQIRRTNNRHHFDEIILETRSDAEEVLSTLIELVDLYGISTVGDFYEAVGLGGEYTDRRYGWYTLDTSTVIPVRGGFILNLPKPNLID